MMGTYSAKIAEEEGKPDPDRAALTGLENELARLAFERSELTITNDERLATVRRQYGALIRRFWTLIPRRPPKLPHLWPPKLLHLAGVN